MKDIDLKAEIEYQESIYRDRADEWFRKSKEWQRLHPNKFDAIVFSILGVVGFFFVTGLFYWIGIWSDLI